MKDGTPVHMKAHTKTANSFAKTSGEADSIGESNINLPHVHADVHKASSALTALLSRRVRTQVTTPV